ncbi:MAG TPA: DUF1579 family protein [Thermoanaerobaculia bacterium]|nr:DUF1579 family protein [Thermoanaerobaculia bacterium]
MPNALDYTVLAGSWRGTVRTWLDPDADPVVNEMSGTFRLAPGGASVLHDSTSFVGEKVSNGWMLIGRNIGTGRLNLIWADSFHTGGGLQTFDAEADGSFLGSYAAGSETWRWRIRFTPSGQGQLTIEHLNITPGGEEQRAIEVAYVRV